MADHRKSLVRCTACHSEHDIKQVITQTLAAQDGKNFTVQELSGVFAAMGKPIPVKTLYRWVYERKLTQRTWNDMGKPMYLLADVMELSERRRRWAS